MKYIYFANCLRQPVKLGARFPFASPNYIFPPILSLTFGPFFFIFTFIYYALFPPSSFFHSLVHMIFAILSDRMQYKPSLRKWPIEACPTNVFCARNYQKVRFYWRMIDLQFNNGLENGVTFWHLLGLGLSWVLP